MKHVLAALAALGVTALAAPVIARRVDPCVLSSVDALDLVKAATCAACDPLDRKAAAIGIVGGLAAGVAVFGILQGVSS